MANGWTPERRARQAELIRTWRPWEQSTGPRTAEGKARTSRNGDKGGQRHKVRAALALLRLALKDQGEALAAWSSGAPPTRGLVGSELMGEMMGEK